MGIYVNPGNTGFQTAVNSPIYVDKTGLLIYTNEIMNTEQRFLCVSRPRRFGKSMAANMLVAYYSKGCDSAQLFAGRKIEKEESYQDNLNCHNVILLDVQQFLFQKEHLDIFIDKIQESVMKELRLEYGSLFHIDEYGLPGVLKQIYAQTGEGFIFLIDEWDCVFRIAKERSDIQKKYLDFLRGLFKGQNYVKLAYMTGILPIKKYGEHSAINIFDEYSMIAAGDLAAYFGFTEEEVCSLCKEKGIEYAELQKWYDGYLLNGQHIYNPKSVIDVMRTRRLKSYWTGTETYEALKVYIDQNFDGLKETVIELLNDIHCKTDPSTSQNDMTTFKTKDDVLTLLIHLGYLAFDEDKEEVFIPNQEISMEFMRAIKVGGWDGLIQSLEKSEELLKSTWELDGKSVATGLNAIHDETASILKYNDENSLTCTILMAYYSAKAYYMNPIMEMPSGKGFADMVYLPKREISKPALVVELKWDKSAKGAVTQIKEKEYVSWIEGYTGEILLVGVNYDKKKKVHECIIEKHKISYIDKTNYDGYTNN